MKMATTTTTTVEDLPADVLACALRRLDGRSLAAASCATTGLRALAADPATWRALCLARWPSLAEANPGLLSSAAVSPQRLFADAFPFPHPCAPDDDAVSRLPSDLVSAVDVYHRGGSGTMIPLLSRVVETSASSSWFLASPFRVDCTAGGPPSPPGADATVLTAPADLELSWILIDPATARAVNVSSRRPVAVDRHWYTGDALVRYALLLGDCKFEATVTCAAEDPARVREICLTVEDADGAAVSGEGTLRLVAAAMAGPRMGGDEGQHVDTAKRRYQEFVTSKRGRKESKARKEVLVDLCCSAASAVAVLTFIAAVALR